MQRPGELAEEPAREGYTAMKIWPFDRGGQGTGDT